MYFVVLVQALLENVNNFTSTMLCYYTILHKAGVVRKILDRLRASHFTNLHYSDAIMDAMASQITGVSIIYSTICSGVDKKKHQSSASLAFVREFTGDWWFPLTRDP